MLTSYWVTCPRLGCHWSGDLLPHEGRHVWDSAVPSKRVVSFQCPRCLSEFPARVNGDDVVPLVTEDEPALPVA